MGNHGLVGRKKSEDMCPETETPAIDNRERLIELCLEDDLQIVNTMFNKPANKLATHTPLEVPKWEKIDQDKHQQLDYILTQKKQPKNRQL